MFPCVGGETCLPRGGAVCAGSCEADDVRICGKLASWQVEFTQSCTLKEVVSRPRLGVHVYLLVVYHNNHDN